MSPIITCQLFRFLSYTRYRGFIFISCEACNKDNARHSQFYNILSLLCIQTITDIINDFGHDMPNHGSSNSASDSHLRPIGLHIKVFASRILKDFSSAINHGAAISMMTSLFRSSEKGSSASGAAGSISQSGPFQAQCFPALFTPGKSESRHSPFQEVFRSQRSSSNDKARLDQSDFEAFMLNNHESQSLAATELDTQSTISYNELSLQKKKKGHSYLTLNPETNVSWDIMRNDTPPNGDFDGAAVVALLSSPDFFLQQEPDVDIFTRTTGLGGACEKSKKADFWVEAPLPFVTHSNPLNLLPDFQNARELAAPFSTRHGLSWKDSESAKLSENAASEYGKLHPWIEILDSYQDQVWGDLLPLVLEARSEIRVNKEIPAEVGWNTPATRRLAMILRHINHLAKH